MKFLSMISCAILSVGLLRADPVADALKQKILQDTTPEWISEQIEADFANVKAAGLKAKALDRVMKARDYDERILVRYQVKGGKISVHSTTPWGKENYRQKQLTEALTELTTICQGKYRLPDCDFIVCLEDSYNQENYDAPVFVFSKKSSTKNEILFPSTEILAKGEKLKSDALKGNAKFPWQQKVNIAYWRGASTGTTLPITTSNYLSQPRFKLVNASLQYPRFIDAKFNWFCQGAETFSDQISDYMGKRIDIPNQLRYKYQLLVDGNACASERAYCQLFGNSVILKQDSDWIEYYYRGLQPNVHYIPLAADFSNLLERVKWTIDNDSVAAEISKNAQKFAKYNLQRADLFYYIYMVLNRYALTQEGLR